MCQQEGVNLQQGMNFRLRGGAGVILMSMRAGDPYADQVEDGGRILVYEGHDRRAYRLITPLASVASSSEARAGRGLSRHQKPALQATGLPYSGPASPLRPLGQ